MRPSLRALPPVAGFALFAYAVAFGRGGDERVDRFRQLDELLPTPNSYRTASGAPGHEYWQQRADYTIAVRLDDERQRLEGSERIRYQNNSPDTLSYLWVQLDPNLYSPSSHGVRTALSPDMDEARYGTIDSVLARRSFQGGLDHLAVRDADGGELPHTVVDTMLRLHIHEPLAPGQSVEFEIDWSYPIVDATRIRARGGYEYFPEDGNYIYEIAQWFPRMAAYTDYAGWQNKAFLGDGEFTLEFGDYEVSITVPDDHVVGSTGVLQNPQQVLEPAWRARLQSARSSERPVLIATREEAEAREQGRPSGEKTWVFHAENVRDFAFASSRKFLWDAAYQPVGGKDVLCMSYWPKEGDPLWSRYSTHAVMHTIEVYSERTFDYPYPVAISVNGPVGGMEYPMICFNGPRPEEDGTYSARTKYGLISVIIHEVGHNWFPMIVNSDERQWTWMDEGLNSFVQYLAEQEWEEGYPSWGGEPAEITEYMASAEQVPIMTNSESILQFGNNAYSKPATALNVLRETVMGRENFDFAFKEYSRRWQFKRPEPADLFRSMEDASAVDLDWFWRGWFYTTDHCDLSLERVARYTIDTRDPDVEKPRRLADREAQRDSLAVVNNRGIGLRVDAFPELRDFYNDYDELDVTGKDRRAFADLLEGLEEDERALLGGELAFYVVDIKNVGGLVMPALLEVEYADGSIELLRTDAELWRKNSDVVSQLIVSEQEIVRLQLDPRRETADVEEWNNHWPRRVVEERLELQPARVRENPMREAREEASGAGASGG